jgi:hypothetical protein
MCTFIHQNVAENVAIFWDISTCSQYVNRSFGGIYHLHLRGRILDEEEIS